MRHALLITISVGIICIVSVVSAVLLVASGNGGLLPLALTILATCAGIALVAVHVPAAPVDDRPARIDGADLTVLVGLAALQLAGLIYMSTFRYHFVQDEFITGYASYTLGRVGEIDWFAGYPEPGTWIAQFPSLYFVLQKPFIELFGLSLGTIRISTWPYHLLAVGLAYLLGRELLGARLWAALAAGINIVLAPNLYMAGFGMHNISSTAFFLAAFYSVVRLGRGGSPVWLIPAGIFTAFCFLTYPSSYLILPAITLLLVTAAVQHGTWTPVKHLVAVAGIALIALLPFFAHAVTQNNYFLQRGDQVNAISRFYLEPNGEEASSTSQMVDHLITNLRALYTPGIGGVTDYWFGRQALFDWLTLTLIVAGLVIALVRGFWRREWLGPLVALISILVFLTGMFLTLPAGGFHRTSLAFPLLGLLISLTLMHIWQASEHLSKDRRLRAITPAVITVILVVVNLAALHTMVREDRSISTLTDSVPITRYIGRELPVGSEITIVSFPNYHLERELIVRTGDRYVVKIRSFDATFEMLPDGVVILFRPSDEQLDRLRERYPSARFLDRVDGEELRRHVLIVPEGDVRAELGAMTVRLR